MTAAAAKQQGALRDRDANQDAGEGDQGRPLWGCHGDDCGLPLTRGGEGACPRETLRRGLMSDPSSCSLRPLARSLAPRTGKQLRGCGSAPTLASH
jgi:hypothetical protein